MTTGLGTGGNAALHQFARGSVTICKAMPRKERGIENPRANTEGIVDLPSTAERCKPEYEVQCGLEVLSML
jgi:hypothetical protein